MGDRSNIVVQDRGARVYLYGHWMGAKAIGHAAHGLRADRTEQGAYLARIVFCSMVQHDPSQELGYGIWPSMQDNQNPVIVLEASEAPRAWIEDREGVRVSRIFSRKEFLDLADESSWRICDPFSLSHDRDTHPWPFEPFLRDAPEPERADWVRDTKWPQLLYSEYGDELGGNE